MAPVDDTVTGPGSPPADAAPAVALKRKLRAVSWPFRALGAEGARELLPGPLPTLLTRCKQGLCWERGAAGAETFSAGRDVRRGGGGGEAASHITLAEREMGWINEESVTCLSIKLSGFSSCKVPPGPEFALQPPPRNQTHTCTWGPQSSIPTSHHL